MQAWGGYASERGANPSSIDSTQSSKPQMAVMHPGNGTHQEKEPSPEGVAAPPTAAAAPS